MPAPANETNETRPPPVERRERYTEMPDPPKRMDGLWSNILSEVYPILNSRYRRDPTTLVGGNGYMARETGDWRTCHVFDCSVAFGVEAERLIWEANGYVVSEVGKPPDFVLEIVTKNTRVRDYAVKRRFYRDVGAVEYWRCDYGGRFYDTPLAGDVLVDGEYRPIKIRRAEDGSLWGYSRALGLYLVWGDGRLRFFDPVKGAFLLNLSETEDKIKETERLLEEADRRADDALAATIENERRIARAEADAARIASDRRAEAERAARAEAEAEVERLRRLLGDLG